jgi:hypothetical protein
MGCSSMVDRICAQVSQARLRQEHRCSVLWTIARSSCLIEVVVEEEAREQRPTTQMRSGNEVATTHGDIVPLEKSGRCPKVRVVLSRGGAIDLKSSNHDRIHAHLRLHCILNDGFVRRARPRLTRGLDLTIGRSDTLSVDSTRSEPSVLNFPYRYEL